MTRRVVSIRNLTKTYRLYPRPTDMLLEALTGRQRHAEFCALEDISFDVEPGTVLGIMGRNGAGKSTLLRIISGTLPTTSGLVKTEGRIAAILELGTGFHPDYTGRENVHLGALCLGMSRSEIDDRFEEIVAFSELEEFIDRPFSTYSTGMQARLTFAVATCVDPDILIVDEALSVGDAKFQLKSFDRIREFKKRGKSILLVSHSINQVVSICDRAILLERGRVYADGDPNKIGHIYHELLFGMPSVASEPRPICDGDLSEVTENTTETSTGEARDDAADVKISTSADVDSSSPSLQRLKSGPAGSQASSEATSNSDENPLTDSAPLNLPDEGIAELSANQAIAVPVSGDDKDFLGPSAAGIENKTNFAENWTAVADAPHAEKEVQELHLSERTESPGGQSPALAPRSAEDSAFAARRSRYGNKWATILNVRLEDTNGKMPVLVQSSQTYRFVVEFVAHRLLPTVCIGFLIRSSWGLDIIGTDTRFVQCPGLPERMQPGERCQAVIELPLALAPGTFFFTMSVVGVDETKYDHWFDCLSFTVAPTPLQLYTSSLLGVPITAKANLIETETTSAGSVDIIQ